MTVTRPLGRDSYIDFFKGFMILWVIHIHTVYWSGHSYIPENVRQLTLLADVPIFFFISGYLTKPSAFYPCLLKTVKTFVRIYLEYIIISCILLAAVLLVKVLISGWGQPDFLLAIRSMLLVIPHGELWDSIQVYNGSLWYIRVYLSLLVVVPLLLGIRLFYESKVQVLFFVLLVTILFPQEYSKQPFLFSSAGSVSFYLVFFIGGIIFREQENYLVTKLFALQIGLSLLLGLIVFVSDGYQLDIQKYKFPPATQYLIYSLLLVHLFIMLKRRFIHNPENHTCRLYFLLHWCGVNTFKIYLFQGFACSIPYFFIDSLVATINPGILYFFLLSFNIGFTLLLTYLYNITINTFMNRTDIRFSQSTP